MSDASSPIIVDEAHPPQGSPEHKKMADRATRVTRSYQTELMHLQSKVTTALILLKNVKPEKGSQDTMNAVIGLLQG